MHINSPGGNVFDGLAILNVLRAHKGGVTTIVDGLAASAASFIAQAGSTRIMARNSQMMIHDAMTLCAGNATDMRETADLLDKASDNLADVYASRSGRGTVADWRAEMRKEVWYSAEEAVAAGLADEVLSAAAKPEEEAVAATWDLSIFAHASRAEAPDPVPLPEPAGIVTADRSVTPEEMAEFAERFTASVNSNGPLVHLVDSGTTCGCSLQHDYRPAAPAWDMASFLEGLKNG